MAKILVADDDPQLLQLLAQFVQQLGHTPVVAPEGETAMKVFEAERPVAAIVDVMMPKVAGQAVSVKIKRKRPGVGVLLISGVYTDPTFVKNAPAQYQCDGFLLKPFTGEQITTTFKPILEKALAATANEPAPAPTAAPATPPPAAPSAPKPAAPAGAPAANVWAKRDPNEVAATAAAAAAVAAAMAGNKPKAPDPVAAAAAAVVGTGAAAPAPSTPAADSIASEGNLEKTSVLSLLYRCAADRLTGKLSFKKDVATKELWIKEGRLLHAASNIESDRLEARLLAAGKIKKEAYADLPTVAKGFGGSIEAALIQLKVVQPGEVFELSKETASALVLDVFRWLGGRFQWTSGAAAPAANSGLSLPLDDLITAGLKEFDGSRLYRALGNRLRGAVDKDLVGIAQIDRLKLSPAEFRLSRMVDGRKSPETIAKEWAGGDQAKELRALQVVYLMSEAGMVRLNEAPADKTASNAGQSSASATIGASIPSGDVETDALKKKLAELEKMTYFEILGVTRDSSAGDVKKAYFKLAKQYHPDTLPQDATADRRKLIDAIFALVSQASSTLEDPKQREAYLAEQRAKETGTDSGAAEQILAAELEFQKAEILLKKKDLATAEKHLTEALKLNPNEAEHHVYWGWLVWLKNKKAQDAVKHIEAGLKMRQNIPSAFLFLGHIYKGLNDMDKAEKAYRKCLSLDEKNGEATSELRVIAMRKGKK